MCRTHTFFLEKVHGRIFFCSSVTTVLSNKGLPPSLQKPWRFSTATVGPKYCGGETRRLPDMARLSLSTVGATSHLPRHKEESIDGGEKRPINVCLSTQQFQSFFYEKKQQTKPCPLPSVSGNSRGRRRQENGSIFFLFFPPPTQAWGPVLSEGGRQRWKLSLEGRGDKNCPFRPERKTYLQT